MSASDKANFDVIKGNYLNNLTTDTANHKLTYTYGMGNTAVDRALNFVRLSGDTMTGDLNFANNDSGITKGIYFQAGGNDGARIVGGAGTNAGYLEIATNDDGNEPIYVRQYGNGGGWKGYSTATRTLTLLDASGNTSIPGSLTAAKDITAPKFHGTADNATVLATARAFQTNLTSDAAVNFNGSANCTMGVTGTLPVKHGGTGTTTFAAGQALIGNGTDAVQTRAIKNITSPNSLGWSTGDTSLINSNTLAYWNGAYSGTSSNISYTSVGKLGNVATLNKNGSTTKFLRGDGS